MKKYFGYLDSRQQHFSSIFEIIIIVKNLALKSIKVKHLIEKCYIWGDYLAKYKNI